MESSMDAQIIQHVDIVRILMKSNYQKKYVQS